MGQYFSIYQIRNVLTDDIYIGQTSLSISSRFKRHIDMARWNKETHLYRAIRKYGHGNFEVTVLEQVKPEDANDRERFWISSLLPAYNMTEGGTGGDTSSSVKYRAGIARRDQTGVRNGMFGKRGEANPNYGKKRTAEQREKLRQGLKAKWEVNEARRAKLSEAMSGFANNPGAKKNAKAIIFEGHQYCSLTEASRRTGRSIEFIRKKGVFLERATLDGALPPEKP
jgi:group I intron endonuclease